MDPTPGRPEIQSIAAAVGRAAIARATGGAAIAPNAIARGQHCQSGLANPRRESPRRPDQRSLSVSRWGANMAKTTGVQRRVRRDELEAWREQLVVGPRHGGPGVRPR